MRSPLGIDRSPNIRFSPAQNGKHQRGQGGELPLAWVMFGKSCDGVARGMGMGLRVWGCGFL
jgi:hypothetical protein